MNVIVPKPCTRLNTKRVLLMEFCDGFAVRDMDAMNKNKVDRNLLMDRICQAFAVQMHVNGFFNAGDTTMPCRVICCLDGHGLQAHRIPLGIFVNDVLMFQLPRSAPWEHIGIDK